MTASDKSTNHIKNILLCRGHPHMPFGQGAAIDRKEPKHTGCCAMFECLLLLFIYPTVPY